MPKSLHCRKKPHIMVYSCIALWNILGKSHSLGSYKLIPSCCLTCEFYIFLLERKEGPPNTCSFFLEVCAWKWTLQILKHTKQIQEQSNNWQHDVEALAHPFLPSGSPCLPHWNEQTEAFVLSRLKTFNWKAVPPCSLICSSYQWIKS